MPRSLALLLAPLALLHALLQTGCVERVLLVRSDPPGAAVYVDGERRGETRADQPLRVPFEFYGTRVLTLRLPGHRPLRRQVELSPPWYQYFPLDFVADLLWPGTIVDEHRVDLRLERRASPGDPAAWAARAERFAAQEERRP